MPTYTQFPDEMPEDESVCISINFQFPSDVSDDNSPQEAVEEWVADMDDDELGEFVREQTWEYWL